MQQCFRTLPCHGDIEQLCGTYPKNKHSVPYWSLIMAGHGNAWAFIPEVVLRCSRVTWRLKNSSRTIGMPPGYFYVETPKVLLRLAIRRSNACLLSRRGYLERLAMPKFFSAAFFHDQVVTPLRSRKVSRTAYLSSPAIPVIT